MTGSKHLISTQEIILLNEERLRYVKLANLYVDNIEAAKDIFQDCILHIYSIKDRLYLSDARNYFAAVVMNRSRDYLKKRSCIRNGKIRNDSGKSQNSFDVA